MNVNGVFEILRTMKPSLVHGAFINGAKRTEAYVLSDDPRAIKDMLPNHRFVSTQQIGLIPKGAMVIVDPMLMVALVGMLMDNSKPAEVQKGDIVL